MKLPVLIVMLMVQLLQDDSTKPFGELYRLTRRWHSIRWHDGIFCSNILILNIIFLLLSLQFRTQPVAGLVKDHPMYNDSSLLYHFLRNTAFDHSSCSSYGYFFRNASLLAHQTDYFI